MRDAYHVPRRLSFRNEDEYWDAMDTLTNTITCWVDECEETGTEPSVDNFVDVHLMYDISELRFIIAAEIKRVKGVRA